MRHRYNHTRLGPPAPVVPVTVTSSSDAGTEATRVGLVDTGAEVTLLPHTLLDSLGAKPAGLCHILGVNRTVIGPFPTYYLHVELAGVRTFIKVVGGGDEVILGRNLLNDFKMELDGPAQTLTVCAPSPPSPAP